MAMMWVFGVLTTVIFWGLLIWGITALWGWARRNRQGSAGGWRGAGPWGGGPWGSSGPRRDDDPEWILAQRFAAGEIDEDEYHRRLSVLRSRPYAGTADRG
jgi:putative membrane protein